MRVSRKRHTCKRTIMFGSKGSKITVYAVCRVCGDYVIVGFPRKKKAREK